MHSQHINDELSLFRSDDSVALQGRCSLCSELAIYHLHTGARWNKLSSKFDDDSSVPDDPKIDHGDFR